MSKQEGNALVRGKDIKGTVVVLSKTQPQQLSLFQTFLPADERYSNTIDLYDAIPKYFPKKRLKKERVEGMFLPMLKREFEYKGERFVVKITPAKLETREGERDSWKKRSERSPAPVSMAFFEQHCRCAVHALRTEKRAEGAGTRH